MNHDEPSCRLVEWWQVTDESAPDVTALEKAVAKVQRKHGDKWKSAVLEAFTAPLPGLSTRDITSAEKSQGSTIWQVMQAIAVSVIALMAIGFVVPWVWRNIDDRGIEPTLTPAIVAQNVAPTVQVLSGRLDALAIRIDDLNKQIEKALSTPTPVPGMPVITTKSTPTMPTPPTPSPPPVISLKGRVEPLKLASAISLRVRIRKDDASEWKPYGESVQPAASTGEFNLPIPTGWQGYLQVDWTLQEVIVKTVAPEETWRPNQDPWSGFVTSIQSRSPVSLTMPLSDLTISLEAVPPSEKFVSELSGKFTEGNRRSFPQNGKPRSGRLILESLQVLGQASTFPEWRLACCDQVTEQRGSFFWAGSTGNHYLIQLSDESQASRLPYIYLPDGINSIGAGINGWKLEEVEGISVLFNQSGSAQELSWSLGSLSGWFKLQAWVAVDSTAEATYEVLVGAGNAPLQPVAGTTVVAPRKADTMSGFADIGVYHLAQPQPVIIRLKAPTEGRVGVGLIRVLKLQE